MKTKRIFILILIIFFCATCKRITKSFNIVIEELSPSVDKVIVRNFSSTFSNCHNISEKEKIENILDIVKESETQEKVVSTLMPGYTLTFLDKEENVLAKLDTLSMTIDNKKYELTFSQEKYDAFVKLLDCQ